MTDKSRGEVAYMSELLPCPFCGGEARTRQTATYCWTAECITPFCGCEFATYGTEAEAIEAWNTRSVTAVAVMGYEAAQEERTCHNTEHMDGCFACSVCGEELEDPRQEPNFAKWCPFCGAKVVH